MEEMKNDQTDTFIIDTISKELVTLPKHINLYVCGPTVYDSAHLGHGRTYILFDTIVRSLKYLGHSVNYVMNITDVDDKILVKTRNFLSEFIKSNFNYLKPFNELFQNNEKYLESYIERIDTFQPILLNDSNILIDDDFLRVAFLNDIKSLELELSNNRGVDTPHSDDLILKRLNFLFAAFSDCQKYLTENFTNLFFEDLKNLNVRKPHFITRVTDYIPVILNFIQKLVENKSAYVSNGSVYFDMEKYLNEGNKRFFHREGETQDEITDVEKNKHFEEKKNIKDFALWKRKYHPLSYDSPYGKGRPGWHIECSAMSNDIFFGRDLTQTISRNSGDFDKNSLHLHGGGVDLQFPHHENEILQSISLNYTERRDRNIFSNYFVHTGHLHIEGLKMSKSLKNFISISDCLQNTNFKVLRLMFLLVPYKNTAIYKPDTVEYAERLWNKITNFISVAEAEIKRRVLLKKRKTVHSDHTINPLDQEVRPLIPQNAFSDSTFDQKTIDHHAFHRNDNEGTSHNTFAIPNNTHDNNVSYKMDVDALDNFLESSSSPNSINNTVEDGLFMKNDNINESLRQPDRVIINLLNNSKLEVIFHLKNNFDFTKSLHCLLNFITITNQKMYEINGQVLEHAIGWINEILTVFGLRKDVDENYDTLLEIKQKEATGDIEKFAMLIKEFREQIRHSLKQKDTKGLYTACDGVRDRLREFGWILEDKGNESVLRKCRE